MISTKSQHHNWRSTLGPLQRLLHLHGGATMNLPSPGALASAQAVPQSPLAAHVHHTGVAAHQIWDRLRRLLDREVQALRPARAMTGEEAQGAYAMHKASWLFKTPLESNGAFQTQEFGSYDWLLLLTKVSH